MSDTVAARTPFQRAQDRFTRNRPALFAFCWLAILALLAGAALVLGPHGYDQIYWDRIGEPPDLSTGHIFGTDYNGRDLFARTMLGVVVSFSIGILSAIVSLVIGVIYGAVSGYVGGRTDLIMMRIVDGLYAVPFMFFIIIVVVLFGRSIVLLFIAVGAIQWLTMARIVRAQTLSIKKSDYITAARFSGAPPWRILSRHVAPNLTGVLIVYLTLIIPDVILIESFISFLGLGVQEPMTSLGVLIADGAKEIYTAPWLLAFPSLTLMTILFALSLLGDGLRDALDPKSEAIS
ncbi:MAG: ABC transporter permease subunit [Pseudomonadota bacterium]